eukprot:926904-Rhodomonas_salina.1
MHGTRRAARGVRTPGQRPYISPYAPAMRSPAGPTHCPVRPTHSPIRPTRYGRSVVLRVCVWRYQLRRVDLSYNWMGHTGNRRSQMLSRRVCTGNAFFLFDFAVRVSPYGPATPSPVLRLRILLPGMVELSEALAVREGRTCLRGTDLGDLRYLTMECAVLASGARGACLWYGPVEHAVLSYGARVLSYGARVYPEIQHQKPHFQYNLYQEC